MRHRERLILICAAAALALSAGAALADNVVINPDFETGDLTGWIAAGESPNSSIAVVSGENGPAEPGTHAVFMDNHVEGLGLVLKQSTLPGNAGPGVVQYAFDLKLGEAGNGGVFFVELFAEQNGLGIIAGSGVMGPYFPADWTTYQGTFTAPAGTDFVTIQFGAITGAVTGSVCTMYVDNVVLDQGVVADESQTWGAVKSLFR